MLLDNFPFVLWINLDRSIERRATMEAQLDTHKLSNTRIQAIDATDTALMASVCIPNPNQSLAVNACICSHLKALRYFVEETREPRVVIFEDDADFAFLPFILFSWSEFESYLPANWGLVQLAITYLRGRVEHTLTPVNPSKRYYCAAAYMITRKSAQLLLDCYYSKVTKMYSIINQPFATADSMIVSVPKAYAIPIFTYGTSESTIHSDHLSWHSQSKHKQLAHWLFIKKNWSECRHTYFANMRAVAQI